MFSRIIGKRNDAEKLGSPSASVASKPSNRHGELNSSERSVRSWGTTFLGGKNDEERGDESSKADLLKLGVRISSMRLSNKKTSEPPLNGVKASPNYHLRKANSQPSLLGSQRRSLEHHNHSHLRRRQSSKSSQLRKREDERGFLDRAFENAVSLSFDEDEKKNGPSESVDVELGRLSTNGDDFGT